MEHLYRELEILSERGEYYVEYNDIVYWYDNKDGYYYKDGNHKSDKIRRCM